MSSNIFVTGIDTGVGKTVISTLMGHALGYAYWKPIQCGDLHFPDEKHIKLLAPDTKVLPSRYRFKAAMSPHAAARLEGVEISLDDFASPDTATIIEGAGGALVPLNERDFIVDLVPQLQASIVIVAQYYLGSINHTLLTLNELKRRNLPILGIVFNGEKNQETRDIILRHHSLPVLLEIPQLPSFDLEVLEEYAGLLRRNIHVYL